MPLRARSSGAHLEDVLAVVADRALGHLVGRVAGDDVGERALAGAVRPHQRVDLALVDRQVDALEDLLVLDRGVQILDLEHRRLLAIAVALAHRDPLPPVLRPGAQLAKPLRDSNDATRCRPSGCSVSTPHCPSGLLHAGQCPAKTVW